MTRKNAGFTLVELLIVIGIMAVLIAILVPSLTAARRAARKSTCAANLGGIGRAMTTYAAQERSFPINQPPKTAAKVGKWSNPPSAVQCDDGTDMYKLLFSASSSVQGDPFVNQWLLVAEGFEPNPRQYVCSGDPNVPAPAQVRYAPPVWSSAGVFLNFGTVGDTQAAEPTFSYGFQYPWSGPLIGAQRWWTNGDGSSARVLAADMGPSMSPPLDDPTIVGPVGNSKNHEGTGQNVLYADGHVTFEKRNDVGFNNDNIYTGDGGNIYVLAGGQKLNTVANLNASVHDTLLIPAYP